MKHAIKITGPRLTSILFAIIAATPGSGVVRGSERVDPSAAALGPVGFLIRTNYHGWANSILVSNGRVEAVIVPAIGRVMQFRFAGTEDGPFWENRELDGKAPDPESKEWSNFGGDKAWPAPQSDWSKITPRAWPPPVAFDAMPVETRVDGFVVTLISPVDPNYGIRARREIKLDPDRPVMTITTTFEKVSGPALKPAVWVISQLKNPAAAYASLPDFERFREGYSPQSEEPPANLKIDRGLLSLTRDPKASHKVGTDASELIWVGKDAVLRIEAAHRVLGDYPDDGSSAEIYTNPDPAAYVELEMLGPLKKLIIGQKITRASTYTLLHRIEADPELEVRRLLAH